MAKFIIRDTMACYVTWNYEVEAESEDAARELWMEGRATALGETIGDSIDFLPQQVEVERE